MKKEAKKTILITGASSGIGKATAGFFAEKGWIVYGMARKNFEIAGVNTIIGDVTKQEDNARVIDTIIQKEGKIDLLINNAGMGIAGAAEFADMNEIKNLFEVNFFGAVDLIQKILPHMRQTGGGKIINVSSFCGFVPMPFQAYYAASKAALDNFAKTLRLEVSQFKIKITNVQPSDIKTDFTANRKKTEGEASQIYTREAIAIAKMEKWENNGMHPKGIAKALYKLSKRKNPPYTKVPGFYKFLKVLIKIFPERLVNWVINLLYA